MSNTYESSAFIYPQRADAVVVNRTSVSRKNTIKTNEPYRLPRQLSFDFWFYISDITKDRVKITPDTFFAKIINTRNNSVVFEKELSVKSESQQIASMKISPAELSNISAGLYRLKLEMKLPTNEIVELFADESNSKFTLEILDSVPSGFVVPSNNTVRYDISVLIVNRSGTYKSNVRNVYKNFRVAKGIRTEILFNFKNSAGSKINVVDKNIIAKIIYPQRNTIVLSKNMYAKNDMQGIVSLRIEPYDTLGLESGLYNVVIETIDDYGNVFPVYSDESYNTSYVLEILDSNISNPVNIYDVDEFFQFDNQYAVSNRQPGSAQFSGSLGISTVVFYTTNFTGEILLEATLESTPAERDWFPLKLTRVTDGVFYTGNSGIDAFVVEGKYYWFRAKYTSSSGSLDKVLISL
jgi:hypothetical protein